MREIKTKFPTFPTKIENLFYILSCSLLVLGFIFNTYFFGYGSLYFNICSLIILGSLLFASQMFERIYPRFLKGKGYEWNEIFEKWDLSHQHDRHEEKVVKTPIERNGGKE